MKTYLVLCLFIVSGLAAPTENSEDWLRTKKSPSYGPSCGGAQLAPVSLYMAASAPQPQYRENELAHEEHSARSYYGSLSGLSGYSGGAGNIFGESAGGYGSGASSVSAAANSGSLGGGSAASAGSAGGYSSPSSAGLSSGSAGGLAGGYSAGAAGAGGYSGAEAHSVAAAASSNSYSGAGASSGYSSGASSIGYSGYGAGAAGSSGSGISSLSLPGAGLALSGGAAAGPAIGLFPNARVGGCNVPLLLSCAPNVIRGHLAESHVYSAPAYRNVDHHMMREADTEHMREVSHHTVSDEISDHHPGDDVPVQNHDEKLEKH